VVVLETKRKLGEYHPKALTDMGNLATTYFEVVVMEKKTQVLGDNHPETVMIMKSLAVTYHKQGCLDDVEALEAVVLEKENWRWETTTQPSVRIRARVCGGSSGGHAGEE